MVQRATINDTVTIHYTAHTRDGGLIEDTLKRKPLVLNLNDEQYAQALRSHIVGMHAGEQKTVLLDPENIFGYRDNNHQLTVPLSGLPAGIREGDQLCATIQNEEVDVWVVRIADEEAILDANHPLSGETIEYTIQLVAIDGL